MTPEQKIQETLDYINHNRVHLVYQIMQCFAFGMTGMENYRITGFSFPNYDRHITATDNFTIMQIGVSFLSVSDLSALNDKIEEKIYEMIDADTICPELQINASEGLVLNLLVDNFD